MKLPHPVYIVSSILFLIAIHIFAAAPTVPTFGKWLFEWQDLAAGLIALIGAYWALLGIRQQIEVDREQNREATRRKHNASRVALPLALSEVSAFVQAISDNVASEIEAYSDDTPAEPREMLVRRGWAVEPLPAVQLPTEVIASFQSFVETLDRESEIRHIAELLSSIQILKSRYESLNFNQVAMEITLYGRLIDAAKVGFLNDCLYNYGRYLDGKSFAVVNEISNDEAWDKIKAKAHNLLFSRRVPDIFLAKVAKMIDGYKGRDQTPWLEKLDLG